MYSHYNKIQLQHIVMDSKNDMIMFINKENGNSTYYSDLV